MSTSNHFQKHVCILFVSIGLITYYFTMKESVLVPNKEPFETYSNDSFSENFEISDSGNDTNEVLSLFHERKPANETRKKDVVNILGLFEFSTKWGLREEGKSELSAALIAIEQVNRMNVLPGYSLNLLVNDTKCDPGVGVDRFFHSLYSNKNILVLLGSGCSNVTESLAHVVPYWNIPQVSFGSKSPNLSDRNKFPLFFRTVPPDSSHNSAKIRFIKHFGWQVVAAFSQSENNFLLPINHLVKELEIANISCLATITFSIENYREQLKLLKDLDIRIILGSFASDLAVAIFCEAFELQMYGGDYVWILQDNRDLRWESSRNGEGCEKGKLELATDGLVLVSDVNSIAANETSEVELTIGDFQQQLITTNPIKMSEFINYVYDAIWAIALALRGNGLITCSSSKYYYHRRRQMVIEFVKKMETLKFLGLSGPVKFSGADRIGDSSITQIQDGKKVQVTVYESDKDRLNFECTRCSKIQWKNGKIPLAQRIVKTIILKIPIFLYYTICLVSLLGICASFLLFYFSIRFRRVKSLKLSSPKLNNVAVLGCILVYFSVILMEIDKVMKNSASIFTALCSAKAYLLSIGFSLIFGSMFAKTYRVHKLFNNCRTSVVKTKLLKDTHLIALISIPVLIDAIILALWVVIDPMERRLHNMTLETSTKSGLVYQKQVEVCGSNNTMGWYLALYGYKAFALIMGVFMAWENRHVKVPTLNDIQYIGICVYSVIFTTVIVIFSNFIAEYVILSYLSSTITILIATSLISILTFIQQFRMIFGRVKNDDLLMQSLGLKFECNTRRFIYKDQKELLHRLEIQNRVFKHEIKALDEEIKCLENQLMKSSSGSKIYSSEIFTISKTSYLDLPEAACGRASWPTSFNQSVTAGTRFSSENRLDDRFFDRFRIFGRLKKIFGSTSSVEQDSNRNLDGNEDESSVVSLEIGEIRSVSSERKIHQV